MIYFTSFIISLILTFFLIRVGNKYGIEDKATDNPLKIHSVSTPVLGGIAMFGAVSLVLLILDFSAHVALVAAGFIIFLFGFIDDLAWRDKLANIYKLLLMLPFVVFATIVLILGGYSLNILPVYFIVEIMTFLAIFLMINSVNFWDGMDGITGAAVAVSFLGFFLITSSPIPLVMILAILGFLVFNLPPAKIFMGDSGAYYLGFMLATLSMTMIPEYGFREFIGVLLILGLPLYEGLSTPIRRIFKKQSIVKGDRDHFFDGFLKKGYSVNKTLAICTFIHFVLVVIGLLIYGYTFV